MSRSAAVRLVARPLRAPIRRVIGRAAAVEGPRVVVVDRRSVWVPADVARWYSDVSFEPETMAWIDRHLAPGAVAVDVGANAGIVTLRMADRVGSGGVVVAVEPFDANLRCLRHNVAGVPGVRVVAHACGKERGTISLHVGAGSAEASVYGNPKLWSRSVEVDVVPLDDLVAGPVDMVKIDVEGAELDVLAGMTRILRDNERLHLVVEWNPLALGHAGRDPAELPDLLRGLGFTIELFDDGALHDSEQPVTGVDDALQRLADGLLPARWYANLGCRRALGAGTA